MASGTKVRQVRRWVLAWLIGCAQFQCGPRFGSTTSVFGRRTESVQIANCAFPFGLRASTTPHGNALPRSMPA